MPTRKRCMWRMADEASASARPPARESYLRDRRASSRPRSTPARRRSIRATASCPRMPLSPRPAPTPGIVFIGPPPAAIRAMGGKSEAKALMEKAGVPLVPGYHGDDQDARVARSARPTRIGYPVLIKAVGRRRRQGHAGRRARRADFADALAGAKREAQVRLRRRPRAASRSI